MQQRTTYPTPYDAVNHFIDVLTAEVQALLAEQFVGLYLHGSLAVGDFDPERSDIDFLVVAASDLRNHDVAALAALHARLQRREDLVWQVNVEGSYIPRTALRRFDADRTRHPVVRVDGSFGMDTHAREWIIQRHVIREYGIVVSGPEPSTLIDAVRPDDLREAALTVLREWWIPQLNDTFRLLDSEYQSYAILTMCRILYTLEHGTVVSKPAAARYLQGRFDGRWTALIDRALAWRRGRQLDDLDETLALISFTAAAASSY